ncbi:hypothetical protein G7085_11345 [Tessaracoccus sp. HDW20]|uniref:hypothetical protein n=1 Tax=Tessaracoccus coleopterorum TaxID=2714950 RepID=UPI0018D341FB|nr:hypothetical protein [Tessaracoccus coleopterorum]NHB85007.1 hypothetical protein [Tessaracoccus coleopterorum]
MTLVTGPAGTGKTLAVADWTVSGKVGCPVAWLSLDRGDAGTARFWTSVRSALMTALPGGSSLAGLPDIADVESLRTFVHAAGGAIVLVLDDVQEIDDGESLDVLEQLLRWPPTACASSWCRVRLRPLAAPVTAPGAGGRRQGGRPGLHPWRGRGADRGVRRHARPRDPRPPVELHRGWAAALRLATLTLQISDDPTWAVERFGGLSHQVSEYLWDEVFHLLPEGHREFLLRTSVSDQLCAPLTTALTGEEDADAMLRALAHEQLLSHQLEGTGWYRTHSLLTEVLRARLRQSRPDLERELQRTAALWFEGNGAWMAAVDHAIASRDWDFAGQVATRSGVVGILGPDRQRFAELTARIPASASAGSAELEAVAAMAAFCRGDADTLRRCTVEAERLAGSLPGPRASIVGLIGRGLASAQAHRDGDAAAMRRAAEEADALFAHIGPADAPGLTGRRSVTLTLRGIGELWSGNPGAACDLLSAAVEACPRASGGPFGEVHHRGLLALAQAGSGQLRRARTTVDPALKITRLPDRARSSDGQWAWLALAVSSMYSGDADEGREALTRCLDSGTGQLNPFVAATVHILSARGALTEGNVPEARRRFAVAQEHLATLPSSPSARSSSPHLRSTSR